MVKLFPRGMKTPIRILELDTIKEVFSIIQRIIYIIRGCKGGFYVFFGISIDNTASTGKIAAGA